MSYGKTGVAWREGRADLTKVARPAVSARQAAPAKAQWLCYYLTAAGVPGLRSLRGRVLGLSGCELFVAGQHNANHTGGIGGELNIRARASGRVPIMVRATTGMPPEGVLITMRLPDWALWLQQLVDANPQRWLGNDDEEQ